MRTTWGCTLGAVAQGLGAPFKSPLGDMGPLRAVLYPSYGYDAGPHEGRFS